jgi:hypothetical protein
VESRSEGEIGSSHGVSVLIEINRYNHCLGQPLLGITARPTDPVFRGGNGLASASLRVAVKVEDWVSGAQGELRVALNWTASGDPQTEQSRETVHQPGCKAHLRSSNTIRPAVAEGKVKAFGMNFAPAATDLAYHTLDASSVRTVGCDG